MWYDVVIPNYFDLEDFEFSADKDDYFLFVGRVDSAKGIHIAMQTVETVGGGAGLIVAGAGSLEGKQTRTDRPVSEYVEVVGVVGPDERERLMARAKATLAPSMFLEPFCGVQIESMLSGTPVISTDWGAFAECNIHGVTGLPLPHLRAVHLGRAPHPNDRFPTPAAPGRSAISRSTGSLTCMMSTSSRFRNIFDGKGWYQENPGRRDLNWLKKYST